MVRPKTLAGPAIRPTSSVERGDRDRTHGHRAPGPWPGAAPATRSGL